MPSTPFLRTDVDRFLFTLLSQDVLLGQWAPGGLWADTPPQTESFWSAGQTYIMGARVVASSNGLVYESLQNGNTNHEPSASPTWWKPGYPCVRWWKQSTAQDVKRQDGDLSRVESQPKFIVCMLDRQMQGSVDWVDGTLGAGKFESAAKRLYTLLHARSAAMNGFQWLWDGLSEYCMHEPTSHGTQDVMLGYWYQIRAL